MLFIWDVYTSSVWALDSNFFLNSKYFIALPFVEPLVGLTKRIATLILSD